MIYICLRMLLDIIVFVIWNGYDFTQGDTGLFAAERYQKIKQVLMEYGRVDVNNLSKLLSVSEVTVRKDLEKLETQGFLLRTHGGAVINEDYVPAEETNEPEVAEIESKKIIGIIASQLIEDGDTVFIGPGTTCWQIAKNLKDKKDIIVITNNLNIASELFNKGIYKVIVTGGDLDAAGQTMMLNGEIFARTIKDIYVDKAFIGVDGISFKRGYAIRNISFTTICKEIKKRCNEFIVVADHTKFNQNAISSLGDLTMADKVVSDNQVPSEYIEYFFENDIQIFTTYELK